MYPSMEPLIPVIKLSTQSKSTFISQSIIKMKTSLLKTLQLFPISSKVIQDPPVLQILLSCLTMPIYLNPEVLLAVLQFVFYNSIFFTFLSLFWIVLPFFIWLTPNFQFLLSGVGPSLICQSTPCLFDRGLITLERLLTPVSVSPTRLWVL